ncbi:tetratricopeptide repeat protein [Salinispira pacifica]|nr:hypothetical protein [Salinispira pacifica]
MGYIDFMPAAPASTVPGKSLSRFIAAAALFMVILLASCRSTANGTPENTFTVPENLPPLISYAMRHIPDIPENESQIFIITSAASSLTGRDNPDDARRVLDLGENLIEGSSSRRRIELLIELSRNYVEAGVISQSIALLEQALTLTESSDQDQTRGRLVQEIITVCFSIGSDALDLLRQAVQKIYIIEDYRLRADLLLDTARRYQESGEGQRSNTLLQQAIPAASSIENQLARARSFSQLALRLTEEGNSDLALRYVNKSVEILQTDGTAAPMGSGIPGTTSDEQISQTLIFLARGGNAGEALSFSNMISNDRLRLNALLEIARAFYESDQLLQSDLVFERIFSILERNAPDELVVSMLLNISQTYFELNDPASAELYLEATESYFDRITDISQKDSLLLEAAILYARLNRLESALETIAQISDPFFVARGYSSVVNEQLNTLGSGDEGPSDELTRRFEDLLERALNTEQESSSLEDVLRNEIAQLYQRLNSFDLALGLASVIQDSYLKALTLSQLHAGLSGTDEEAAIIESYSRLLLP